jgi:hypothetical protein
VPWVSVLVQSALVLFFLVALHSDYIIALSDVGTGIAFVLTTIAFFVWKRSVAALLAIASCSFLLYIFAQDIIACGLMTLIPSALMLLVGIGGYWLCKS